MRGKQTVSYQVLRDGAFHTEQREIDWDDYHARTAAELAQEEQEAEEDRWRPNRCPVQDDDARDSLDTLMPDNSFVGHYAYQDRSGIPVLASGLYNERTGDQWGLQRRMVIRAFDGTWSAGELSGLRPLYRLPQVIGTGPGDLIVVCQDEDDVDTAVDLGFVATTCLDWGSGIQRTDWMPLARRDIVMIPKHGPGGDAFFNVVADVLVNLMPRSAVRVCRLPNLQDGEGLEEWCMKRKYKSRTSMVFGLTNLFGDGFSLTPKTEALGISLDADEANALPNGQIELRFDRERLRSPGAKERLDWVHIFRPAKTVERTEAQATNPTRRRVIRGSEVQPKDIEWLWPGRIPKRFVTIFYGATDVGKSYVSHDITARLTTGKPWPDAEHDEHGEIPHSTPGNVLLISEDSHDYVLRPRLDALGADPDRYSIMTWEAMMEFTIEDTTYLEQTWIEAGEPDLIIIDPPTNFLGARSENSNKEVRGAMMQLVQWLLNLRKPVACILITHTKKPDGKSLDSIYRLLGSVAWGTTARIAHSFAAEPEDPAKHVFACAKINIGEKPISLNYRLEQTETSGRLADVVWLGETATTSTESLNGEPSTKKLLRGPAAAAWVTERFREKRVWSSNELKAAAQLANISRSALFQTPEVKALPITRRQWGGAWHWEANEGWPA